MTEHIWIDGPDGHKYHCPMCGISKTDDYAEYDTCEKWVRFLHSRLHSWGFGRNEWREYLRGTKNETKQEKIITADDCNKCIYLEHGRCTHNPKGKYFLRKRERFVAWRGLTKNVELGDKSSMRAPLMYIITKEEREKQMEEQGYYEVAIFGPRDGYELHPAFRQLEEE